VRLVIVRAIIVIVPLVALLVLNALPLSVTVFNPTACISIADDVTQVAIIPTM
jgi:hypothetical protein